MNTSPDTPQEAPSDTSSDTPAAAVARPHTPSPARPSRVTVSTLQAQKREGRRIVMVTAYDYPMARSAEAAGVDAVLVGDSLGMVVLGYDSTLPVTVDDMVRHTAAVSRACECVLVVADMPFMSYQSDVSEAMRNAYRLVVEGGGHAVKLEGATATTLEAVRRLVGAGIPVMGHLGLTPQSVNVLGGYRTQGKDAPRAARLISDAAALQDAGAFAVVLELVPAELAERITARLDIPTIGIGAGGACDGQVQVAHDLLGMSGFLPRHATRYADLSAEATRAFKAWADDVVSEAFPAESNTTHVDSATVAQAESLAGRGEVR
ncbi:MAG: 3-methyl-2-oxobutanoate hydroxymethyltransferase [Coriobacteriia bacterium]|nr:3-methyl-2-oxobutanoate hydroxymethyltransferase [Coriobacteriia bacterium]